MFKRNYTLFFTALFLIVIVALTLGLVIYFTRDKEVLYSGGVVTNGFESAQIASDVIAKGGSAVDAAIAALFAEGVTMPQSMGLGGGFVMMIYSRETGEIHSLNAREVAPEKATYDMFGGNSSLSSKGGLSIAVPGELRGYWEAHQKFGNIPWKEVIMPTVELCRKGHLVTPYLAQLFQSRKNALFASESLREVFIDPNTNDTYPEGSYLKRLKLADTLEVIAKEGANALYNGSLTEQFVADIQAHGGIITVNDMNSYQPEWVDPVTISLPFKQTLHTFPLPGSGVILSFILNILKNFLDTSEIDFVTNWQRITESLKYGYGRRTDMGDINFVPEIKELVANLTNEDYASAIRSQISDTTTSQDPKHYGANASLVQDYGTAHINVIAPNGDAVAVTSTINFYFGSDIRSTSTGIILNNEMDDFSSPNIISGFDIPPSPANYIEPGKRPLSSMCPTIILDNDGDVILAIGAAGGTKITTSTAQVIIRHLWFNESLDDSVEARRLHHQLFPMIIQFEKTFNTAIIEGLAEIGHNFTIVESSGFSAVTALSRASGYDSIVGKTDPRRIGGQVELF